MDEPEKLKHESEKTVVKDRTTVVNDNATVVENQHRPMSRRTGMWIIIVSSILVLMLIAGLIGASVLSHYGSRYIQDNSNDSFSTMMRDRGARWHTNMPTIYVQTDATVPTLQMTGVVTAVNGDTITVAGNGTSTTVKTTSGTTYNTVANKVSVNDTVIINGVKSGDTFTANSVDIVNY